MSSEGRDEMRQAGRSGALPKLPGGRPTVGFMCERLITEYSTDVWNGVRDAVEEHEANLIYFSGNLLRDPRGFNTQANVIYDLADEEMIDGLVLWGAQLAHYATVEEYRVFCERYRSLPIVNIGLALEGVPSLLMDNYQGMRDVVAHLIEVHGHRRIAYICGAGDTPEVRDRYRGYADALAEHGVLLDPGLVVTGSDLMKESWGYSGEVGVHILLDGRKLRPPVDFEALVGYDDGASWWAFQTLQARGLRVPADVAMASFDDTRFSQYCTPPFTTARQSFYDLGWRATEMLLALLRGEEVPEQVILPMKVIVRQSCGCANAAVVAAGPVARRPGHTVGREDLRAALAPGREKVVAEMVAEVGGSKAAFRWAEQVLDGFLATLTANVEEESPAIFLRALDEMLYQAEAASSGPPAGPGARSRHLGQGLPAWQGALSALRQHVLPFLDDDVLPRAESLCQQARVLIGEMAWREQAYQVSLADRRGRELREIGAALITTFDVAELMDVLAEGLSHLGIPSAYLSLYEDPEKPLGWSRLVLAYDEVDARRPGRIELPADGVRFPSRRLVPEGRLPDRQFSFVVAPLYFRERQLGFVLFEVGPRDEAIYDVLRGDISSALQGALLLRERERAEVALRTAYAEVEQQVAERTAELQQEIVERNWAEAEREQLRRLLQDVTDSISSTLIALDLRGRVLLWNPAAEALTGRTAAQVQGRSLWQTCPGLRRYRDLFERVLRERRAAHRHREQLATESGVIYRDVGVFPLVADDIEGAVLRIDDVTERLHIEEMMLQSAKMASVGRLAAGVAHEINNPLGGMMQSAQMLQMIFDTRQPRTRERLCNCGVDTEKLDRYLQERGVLDYLEGIRSSGSRAAKIVSDLLSFSRKGPSHSALYDLNALVEQTLDLMATDYDLGKKHDFRDVEVVCELSPALPRVLCDGPQIQQVVLNSVRNAVQGMAAKKEKMASAPGSEAYRPRLALRTSLVESEYGPEDERPYERAVRLEIEDNGPGISKEAQARMFEPFFTTREEGAGTGLGLWLSWSIVVERHKGRIWAEPGPEGGARFVIELPVYGVR